MSTEKKSALKVMIIMLCIVLFAGACLCLSPERGRLYFGSARIKGTVSVYLDGEPTDVSGVTVTDISPSASVRDLSFGKDGNTVTISDEAGEKMIYKYELDIPELGSPVKLSVMHRDWHQVTRFGCELYLTNTEYGVKAEYKLCSRASNLSVFDEQKTSESFTDHEDYTIRI
ncbi:MAG: hypothetical protein K6B74_06430 [Ruminococcus sp.]|nr:hypothetical protein [Ruminococcus sp.]